MVVAICINDISKSLTVISTTVTLIVAVGMVVVILVMQLWISI